MITSVHVPIFRCVQVDTALSTPLICGVCLLALRKNINHFLQKNCKGSADCFKSKYRLDFPGKLVNI